MQVRGIKAGTRGNKGLFLLAQTVKNLLATQETWVRSLGQEDLLENGLTTHSSILAWEIPRTEEPEGLQSTGLQRVGHGLVTNNNSSCFIGYFYKYYTYFWRLVAKSCLILCNPMDSSPPGSSVHGISQARIPEWVAISFSRASSPTYGSIPCLLHCWGFLYRWATREIPKEGCK